MWTTLQCILCTSKLSNVRAQRWIGSWLEHTKYHLVIIVEEKLCHSTLHQWHSGGGGQQHITHSLICSTNAVSQAKRAQPHRHQLDKLRRPHMPHPSWQQTREAPKRAFWEAAYLFGLEDPGPLAGRMWREWGFRPTSLHWSTACPELEYNQRSITSPLWTVVPHGL